MNIEPVDIAYAKEMGYAIKLLAIMKRTADEVELRVHPTFIPAGHLLANVKGVYNAIFVKGDQVGENLFYGKGAGKFPTASAVIADVVDIARGIAKGAQMNPLSTGMIKPFPVKVKKIDKVCSRYYIRFSALDKPGVLAKIGGILGQYGISIASVTQKEERRAKAVPIVMITHYAVESKLRAALKIIDRLPAIKKRSIAIRMEELS